MKKFLSIILAITLTLTLFASCGKPETALTSAELLDLGEKYLLDLDYEQAIVYFNQVIEVEPKNARAYLGAAESYVALGDIESAIAILQKGIELVDDPTELQAVLAELLGENEEQEEQDEVVQEETVEIEPAYETTAVYYYNADESVSCCYYVETDTAPYSIYWNPVSGAGYYATYYSEAEGVAMGTGYTYTAITNTSVGFIKSGYIYYIIVEAYTGSSYGSRGSFISTVGTAIIEVDGTVSSTTGGLTVTREDGYYCTLSCNQSSFSTDTIYCVYVDGALLTVAKDTTQSFILPSGSYEITVIASNTYNALETIGSLTLTVGDTSSVDHGDEDYEYVYDSDGKAISRTITTYAEDGSHTVEYQTRTN